MYTPFSSSTVISSSSSGSVTPTTRSLSTYTAFRVVGFTYVPALKLAITSASVTLSPAVFSQCENNSSVGGVRAVPSIQVAISYEPAVPVTVRLTVLAAVVLSLLNVPPLGSNISCAWVTTRSAETVFMV